MPDNQKEKPFSPSWEHEPLPEGEEAPPPYVHTMAIVRWVILGTMAVFALIMILSYFNVLPWLGKEIASEVQYNCPMHPTYIASQPGDCPICGMSLVPVDKNNTGKANATPVSAVTSSISPGKYFCPMHPDVVSDKPGKCPKCGMFLSERKSEETVPASGSMEHTPGMAGMEAHAEHQVPGLVPITLTPERLQLIGLRKAKVQKQPLTGGLRLVGFVTADETKLTNIHTRVSGWIQKLFVNQTGQKVNAGDPLLSLYSQDLYQAEQDYTVARSVAATGDSVAARLLSVNRQRLQLLGIPDDEIIRLEKTGIASDNLTLRSPFTGYVLSKNALSGQYIGPEVNLFTIADLSTVWILADVYEQDLWQVNVGQKAQLRLEAYPGEIFTGQLGFIYPTISLETRTLKVRLEFPNPDLKLRPGLYGEVNLVVGGASLITIPTEAVMDGGDLQYAFVVKEGNHFEPRHLVLGVRQGNWVQVLKGVSPGEEVVTSANFLIDSESRLQAAVAGLGQTPESEHAGHNR